MDNIPTWVILVVGVGVPFLAVLVYAIAGFCAIDRSMTEYAELRQRRRL